MKRSLDRVLLIWVSLELTLATAFLTFIVGLVGYQIVAQSFFGAPLPWAEEAATLVFIWMVLLGASASIKLDRHVKVAAFETVIGKTGNLILDTMGRIVIVVSAVWITYLIWPFIGIEAHSTSVSLPIKLPKSLFFSVPLVVCCVSMTIGVALLVLRNLLDTKDSVSDMIASHLMGDMSDEAGLG